MTSLGPVEGEFVFPLEARCHEPVVERLRTEAEHAGLKAFDAGELRLVVEEVLTNVVKYSGAAEQGMNGTVRWRMQPRRLELQFEDPGRPFDPLGEDGENWPDEERCEGGMGILLVRAMVDSLQYRRKGDRNCLALTLTT